MLVLSLMLAVLAGGCTKTYRSEFLDQAEKKGWTKEQQRAALAYSYRVYFTGENDDGERVILYSRLPKQTLDEWLLGELEDMNWLLGYEDEWPERYLKRFGLRPYYEHQERVFKAIHGRIRVAQLNDEFEKALGKRSRYSPHRDEFGYDHRDGYDSAILALDENELRERFTFSSEVIEEAKEQGLLQEIERYALGSSKELAYKDKHPDFPNDPNRFIWQPRRYQLEMTVFKIMTDGDTNGDENQPRDNHGNYAEVYRIINGNRESRPAIRAFLSGKGGNALAVIDTHREGQVGFGLPDHVEKLSESRIADSAMIERIFPEDLIAKRVAPTVPPVRLDIVPSGTEIDMWKLSQSDDGWNVPFTYRNDDNDNYSVKVRFVKKKNGGENHSKTKTIHYVEKRWQPDKPGAGKVYEYFLPREPYDEELYVASVESRYERPDKIRFEFLDGTEVSVVITPGSNKVLPDAPEAIGYQWLDKLWVIKDFDGDGTYEKRREVTDLSKEF